MKWPDTQNQEARGEGPKPRPLQGQAGLVAGSSDRVREGGDLGLGQ